MVPLYGKNDSVDGNQVHLQTKGARILTLPLEIYQKLIDIHGHEGRHKAILWAENPSDQWFELEPSKAQLRDFVEHCNQTFSLNLAWRDFPSTDRFVRSHLETVLQLPELAEFKNRIHTHDGAPLLAFAEEVIRVPNQTLTVEITSILSIVLLGATPIETIRTAFLQGETKIQVVRETLQAKASALRERCESWNLAVTDEWPDHPVNATEGSRLLDRAYATIRQNRIRQLIEAALPSVTPAQLLPTLDGTRFVIRIPGPITLAGETIKTGMELKDQSIPRDFELRTPEEILTFFKEKIDSLRDSIHASLHRAEQRLRDTREAAQVPDDRVSRWITQTFTRPLNPTEIERATGIVIGDLRRFAASQIARKDFHPSAYPQFFPNARSRKRKIVAILGPTNSGKTYRAFQALRTAANGTYLAPLRLLAAEGADTLNELGCPCSMVTGEEKIPVPGAHHVSSTIEMTDYETEYEVAVIDEVQMLADRDRGWAWTAALCGVNAKTVYCLGSPDAEKVLREFAHHLKEPIEFQFTERLAPLRVLPSAVPHPQTLQNGTAVVAFSRANVLSFKDQLGACAAVYGNLSPEVRRAEAKRFREGEVQFVAATDAIGMGLNLPIKNVIFSTTTKFDGVEERRLTPSEVRQIAGRAGRYGKHEVGWVGAMNKSDHDYLRKCLSDQTRLTDLALWVQVAPSLLYCLEVARALDVPDLWRVLSFFAEFQIKEAFFRRANIEEMIELAAILKNLDLPLSIRDQYTLCCVPVAQKEDLHLRFFKKAAQAIGNQAALAAPEPDSIWLEGNGTDNSSELHDAESFVKLLCCYSWLHYRFLNIFPDLNLCFELRTKVDRYILASLQKRKVRRACLTCSQPLPPLHPHKLCDACFFGAKKRQWFQPRRPR